LAALHLSQDFLERLQDGFKALEAELQAVFFPLGKAFFVCLLLDLKRHVFQGSAEGEDSLGRRKDGRIALKGF
jgi:hypothetical protein